MCVFTHVQLFADPWTIVRQAPLSMESSRQEYWLLSHLSRVQRFVTPWNITRQAPLSMESSRQEYWSWLQFTTPGDLPNPGIEPASLASPELAGRFLPTSATWEAHPISSMQPNMAARFFPRHKKRLFRRNNNRVKRCRFPCWGSVKRNWDN